MNLLRLINSWLDKFCQITTKVLQEYFPKYFGTEHSLFFFEELAGALLCHIRRRASQSFTVLLHEEPENTNIENTGR
jgi:hypothetical protein